MTNKTVPALNRKAALIDLTIIIGTLIILKFLLLNVESFWSFAGPLSLLAALGVATWPLKNRRITWRSLGLACPTNIWQTLLWTVIALVVTMAVGAIAQSISVQLLGGPNEALLAIAAKYQGRFDDVPGNLPVFIFWLAVAWIIGGFAEEMLFRAALLTRFENLFAGLPFPATLAVCSQAIIFGQQHYYYQGLSGTIATGVIGLASGLLYLSFKRNLWTLVLSHGLSNTIGLTLIFSQPQL